MHEALTNYLNNTTDEQIVELFKQIRALQINGYQLKEAILKATTTKSYDDKQTDIDITSSNKHLHKDNIPAYLALRHRAKLVKFRKEGYGYGKIAKLLKQRNIYNKVTGKEYSRSTIKRAIELIEKGKK